MARKNHRCQEFTAEKEPSAQLLWSRTIGPWAGSVVSPSGIGVQRDKNTTGGFGRPLLFGLPRALSRRAGSRPAIRPSTTCSATRIEKTRTSRWLTPAVDYSVAAPPQRTPERSKKGCHTPLAKPPLLRSLRPLSHNDTFERLETAPTDSQGKIGGRARLIAVRLTQ
jgi:hypothetical protein